MNDLLCAVCGDPITAEDEEDRVELYKGWELDGEVSDVGREVLAVVHLECFERMTPLERQLALRLKPPNPENQ